MIRADILASQYRVIVERGDDHAYLATCAELPDATGRGLNVGSAMDGLRDALAARLPARVTAGDAPSPLRDAEGAVGAWAADLELLENSKRAPKDPSLEKPLPSALRAIAQWTTDRYRAILEVDDDGRTWVGAGVEMPDAIARGETPGDVVAELRSAMADRAYAMLDSGEVPPEPRRDVEARSAKSARRSPVARVA
jgi:predicted RNase H-like HicB family nuclease